jgi:hypothetical protein
VRLDLLMGERGLRTKKKLTGLKEEEVRIERL